MKLSEMIKQLETLKEKFGDLQIGTWTDECDWFEVEELIEETSEISSGFITLDLKQKRRKNSSFLLEKC